MRLRRPARTLTALAIVAAVVAPLSACSGADAGGADDRLTISRDYMATTLNPAINPSDATLTLNYLETPTTIRRDSRGVPRIVPSLAESWHQLDDASWRFTLRPAVTFSDGEKLGAQAVKYSLELIQKRSDALGPLFHDYAITVVDDRTFDIRNTTGPDALIPQQLSWLFVFPPKYVGAVGYDAFGTRPVGTGPYIVTDFVAGRSVTMRANPRYWGKRPAFATLQANLESDPFTRVATVESGKAQLATGVSPSQFDRVRSSSAMRLRSVPGDTSLYLQLNVNAPPLNDPRVAEAVALTVDRATLVTHVFDGQARAFNSLYYPTMLGGLASRLQLPITPDPDRARELVREAGAAARAPIQLIGSSDVPEAADVLQILQSELAAVGLRAEIRVYDTADAYFASWIAGGTPGLVLAVNELIWPDPALLFDGFFSPSSLFSPLGSWKEVPELTRQARSEPDPAARLEPYGRLQDLIVGKHSAYLSLMVLNEVDAIGDGIVVPADGGTFAEITRAPATTGSG